MSDTIGHLITAVVNRASNESQCMLLRKILTVHEECHNGRSPFRLFFAIIVPEGLMAWPNAVIAGFAYLVVDAAVEPLAYSSTFGCQAAIAMNTCTDIQGDRVLC